MVTHQHKNNPKFIVPDACPSSSTSAAFDSSNSFDSTNFAVPSNPPISLSAHTTGTEWRCNGHHWRRKRRSAVRMAKKGRWSKWWGRGAQTGRSRWELSRMDDGGERRVGARPCEERDGLASCGGRRRG
ncbi:hypothetical protein Ancab_036525 [Ancistrocladus abbreviatus]